MIRLENLSVAFGDTEVVKHVNLELWDGEILGIVGESGSGKSVTALTLMGLVSDTAHVTTGRILFDGEVLLEAGKERDKALFGRYQGEKMSMVFQEPMTSLNPTQRVGRQVEEVLKLHTGLGAQERKERVLDTFRAVGLREEEKVYGSYPHQLSGGMRQRVMIAMALILHPALVVADEPTTALDVTIQNQIIALLRQINQKQKNAMLFITHDLNLARRLCSRIAVMKDGQVVEQGDTEEIFSHPGQTYTKRLLEAVPSRLQPRKKAVSVQKEPEDAGRKKKAVSVQKEPESSDRKEPATDNTIKEQTQTTKCHEAICQDGQKPNIQGRQLRESCSPVLEVRNLSVYYRDGNNSLFARKKPQCVVQDASFAVYPGESLGLVGESGCGKTSLSKAILGMNRDIRGQILHHSQSPQMVFQDPYSSLNPARTIGWLLQEPLRALGVRDPRHRMSKGDMEEAAYDMLQRVGMEEKYFHRKPSQLSGGQRQRVSIGQALITRPSFIVADEPVSALDVTIQAQIMELMQGLQQEMGLSYLFISHDIHVVYQMCDRIMIMKDGRILEMGETEEIFHAPREEYTKQLLCNC